MKHLLVLVLAVTFLLCTWKALAQPPQTPGTPNKAADTTVNTQKKAVDEGELRFKQNCIRCHNPPEALSEREVKAVVRHMRLRASLTAEDEQLILKYLAP